MSEMNSIAHLRASLERQIEPDPNSGCWLWAGAMDHGYGRIYRRGERKGPIYTHRLSWMLHRGPIPPGLFVCHKCDTPACCNPAHLFVGTQKQNMQDMFAKGRHDGHGQKLSDEAVRHIRRDPRPYREIGADFGVSGSTAWRVKHRRIYAKVA